MASRLAGRRGQSAVEFAVAAVIFIPLVIFIFYAISEASYAYLIKGNLDEAARRAARKLAVDYGQDPVNSVTTAHQDFVYSSVRINSFVVDNSQFNKNNSGYAVYQTTTAPFTVSVLVTYPTAGIPGKLPPFPNPDFLHVGSNFVINASSTVQLE